MLELIESGGWLMIPIILCSIVATAISIERWWMLRPSRVTPSDLLPDVWDKAKKGKIDASLIKELRTNSPLGHVFAAGLSQSTQGREAMRLSIQETAGVVIHDLERYLSTLGTIAAIAPLLGLLGTVVGMIKVFSQIMLHGAGNAALLAGGISEALITTATGLSVAIPTLVMHRYLQRRIDSAVVTMEQESNRLVDSFSRPQ